ncbi:MAG: TetR/AcrR family transcriptional regulator [Clostridia bacterium]|nr:TetR/AcrR family transcriptional regulator [Clostridia bacterium]
MEQDILYARHRERRMEEAVYAAAELFLKEGIEKVKMTDVADAAAMGVASLYRYFGSKNVLVIRAGALLWRDVRTMYEHRFEPSVMAGLTGMERIRLLFSLLEELYRDHRPFISLIGQIDDFLAAQDVPRSELKRYEESLLNFMTVFLEAFEAGVADGTVRPEVDPAIFFRTVCHSATALALKLIRGPLLPGEHLEDPAELHLLLDFALAYLTPDR